MSNGIRNCALGVCCPPGSAAAKDAFAADIAKGMGEGAHTAKEFAYWLLDNYDLAPHGTTGKLYAEIAALALHT